MPPVDGRNPKKLRFDPDGGLVAGCGGVLTMICGPSRLPHSMLPEHIRTGPELVNVGPNIFHEPQSGDVVSTGSPVRTEFMKSIIGLPGETVRFRTAPRP